MYKYLIEVSVQSLEKESTHICVSWVYILDLFLRFVLDRMVVGFTTTYAISAWCCEFEYRSGRSVQHYVIKFVSDLRQFSPVSSINKTYRRDIGLAEILLKVALNTIIKQTNKQTICRLLVDVGIVPIVWYIFAFYFIFIN